MSQDQKAATFSASQFYIYLKKLYIYVYNLLSTEKKTYYWDLLGLKTISPFLFFPTLFPKVAASVSVLYVFMERLKTNINMECTVSITS